MKPKLTESDFLRAAQRLNCEVAAIKSVAKVESAGAGFYADGFPVILFERHLFRRFTSGKYNKTHPHLSGPPGGYGPAGKNQRVKFSQAFELNPDAAMKSCSWGKFQILGSNHKVCGYATVGEFVDAMKESEGKQLDAFVSFVIGNKLDKSLRDKNWASFARGYNGKGYAKNKYDIKMRDAYDKFLRASSAVAPVSSQNAHIPSDSPQEAADSTAEQTPGDTTVNADNVQINESTQGVAPAGFAPEDKVQEAPPKEGSTTTATTVTILGITVPTFAAGFVKGIQEWIEKGFIDVKEVAAFLLELIRNNVKYVSILAGLIVAVVIVKKIFKQLTFLLTLYILARPDLHNVTVIPAESEPKKAWWRFW